MEVRLYFQMLQRGWWIILLTVLTALAGALGISYLSTPQYTATARFIVSPSNDLVNSYDVLSSIATLSSQSVMSTYAEVMNSKRIYDDTLTFLQLQPANVKDYAYEGVVVSNSSIIELAVTGPDPQMAAKIANAIGYQTINFTRGLNQVFTVEFLDTAVPPTIPSSPRTLLNAILATILGLVIGGGLAILIEQLQIPLEILKQRTQIDSITGVYNRKHFPRLVEEEIAKDPKDVLSLGILELNGLQDLVETFPIAALQKVFQKVTETLRKELRGHDVIGRWNNISFIIMLPNTSGAAASRIFNRIFQALSQPIELKEFDLTLNLDIHIGGAEYTNNITAQELFEKTDSALEQARRDNVNPVYIWEIKSPFWAGQSTTEN